MSRLCLYYRQSPEKDRWIPGDRFVRPAMRRILRGPARVGGVDKVFINLCLGLDKLRIPYEVNLPFEKLRDNDKVGVLGRGRNSLEGYTRSNPIVAGIGLMTHPSEWPTLCEDYPVVRYLQHSEWANNVYIPYFKDRCAIWPVGIDTGKWKPQESESKVVDFLLYNKVRWDVERYERELIQPVREELKAKGLSFKEVRYGFYEEAHFHELLRHSRGMIFLCEHESQGLAYQECLACDVPILAWDQGWCLDRERFKWGQPQIPATSVPYFDERCGTKFQGIADFPQKLAAFREALKSGAFRPRNYIMEQLTLERCAQRFIDIVAETTSPKRVSCS